MKKMKTILAALLAVCMVFAMPNIASADEPYVPTTGTGTEADPMVWDMGPTVPYAQAVPAGEKVYVLAYGMGDYVITIESETAYVIIGETKYDAVDGKVEAPITIGRAAYFYLGNAGTEDATYTVSFNAPPAPLGTMDNPEALTEESGSGFVVIDAGSQGYYYTYTAPADGTFNVSVYADDDDWNPVGWMYVVNNLTSYQYGDYIFSDSENAAEGYSIEVSAGDEISIMVNTYNPADMWANPTGNVYTSYYFEAPAGTESNPHSFDDVTATITIPVGTTYYLTPFAGSTMTVTADGEYKLVFGEEEIASVNGVVSIEIPAGSGWGPSAAYFHIISETELTAKVEHAFPAGSQNNPDEIEAGEHTATFEAGAQEYYYTWIAPADGKVTIAISSEGGWQYTVNNLTSYVYCDTQWSDSDPLAPSTTLDVAAGDEIQIKVVTYNPADMFNAPAGTVKTTVTFAPAVIEGTGDFSSTMIYVIVLMGAALVGAGFVAKKRFA